LTSPRSCRLQARIQQRVSTTRASERRSAFAHSGIYQVELPPGAETVRHDHIKDGAEDVYAVIKGTGTVVVGGREIPVGPGQFIAVTAESARHFRAGDGGLVFIAVCATPT
jgi:mannose-6-phosphate isomerase-like protein (cupin superfamily)